MELTPTAVVVVEFDSANSEMCRAHEQVIVGKEG